MCLYEFRCVQKIYSKKKNKYKIKEIGASEINTGEKGDIRIPCVLRLAREKRVKKGNRVRFCRA